MAEHGRSGPAPTAPSGPAPRAPTHAERCRTLVAGVKSATLCTHAKEPAGYPYGSLVSLALDDAGRPLLLLSEMAEHTANLHARNEASLLISEMVTADREPLALGRVTLIGPCDRVSDAERSSVRERFLAQQPRAAMYVDFTDFNFYRLEPMALRYVGGFGRMSWVTADDYRAAEPDPLRELAAGILEHMNTDHADANLTYATKLLEIGDATSATMTHVDRYGFDLAVMTPNGPRAARLAFADEAKTSDEVRRAVVALLKEARAR